MLRFLFGSILVSLLGITLVQAQEEDSLSAVGKYEPLALRVGVSVNNLLRSAIRENDTQYSFQADAVFGRYMLAAEYGRAELSRSSVAENPFTYESEGSFFRVGPDVNLLVNQAKTSFRADGDIIFFGLRFARAQVTDKMTLQTRDDTIGPDENNNAFWPSQEITAENSNRGVIWLEMTAGMKVRLYRNIFLGYNLRFKFARNFLGNPSLIPYEIPGFGPGENEEAFRFDYYLIYQIPFKKKSRTSPKEQ
ncbi:DUF6048 family protein [Tunicatimonas pelagia]|uniref:DUF6048 family protein n=1 Tax=Tunicatimonas pelagia TaxID=931531 RepID=UPI0026652D57|nr:DUF6048 family protein [Tunicatimonas pelagia]WKN41607.1 DUF6048 family protein [Tunicatimonas pelagia]